MECQVNVKSQSDLDIGGRETCHFLMHIAYRMYVDNCHDFLYGLSLMHCSTKLALFNREGTRKGLFSLVIVQVDH